MLSWWEKQQILWSLPPEQRIEALLIQSRAREAAQRARRETIGPLRLLVGLSGIGFILFMFFAVILLIPLPWNVFVWVAIGGGVIRIIRRMRRRKLTAQRTDYRGLGRSR